MRSEFFRKIGRRVYVSSELGVFYPDEPRFAPDVLAVLDVEPGERKSWVVAQDGKGLSGGPTCNGATHVGARRRPPRSGSLASNAARSWSLPASNVRN